MPNFKFSIIVLFGLAFSKAFQMFESGKTGCPCAVSQICILDRCMDLKTCPAPQKFSAIPKYCPPISDPSKLPKSPLETWFPRELFNDLFPKSNLGSGPHACLPYSYDSFIIASRYFPDFASESPRNGYSPIENWLKDLAAFFAHVLQGTGENDLSLYGYCSKTPQAAYFSPCNQSLTAQGNHRGCYFGRGPLQLTYNFNYAAFSRFLFSRGLDIDLLAEPNRLLTNRSPPLAFMAALWYYMTPQPPKPSMHDIIMGYWQAGERNEAAGFSGPIFGPTSQFVNENCPGEDDVNPGGPGESRRIKAYRWFTNHFKVESGPNLSCRNVPVGLSKLSNRLNSYQPDWSRAWKSTEPCDCVPANYSGVIPFYQAGFYPKKFVDQNEANRRFCRQSLYSAPDIWHMNPVESPCLLVKLDD